MEHQAKEIAEDMNNLEQKIQSTLHAIPMQHESLLAQAHTFDKWISECDRRFTRLEQDLSQVESKYCDTNRCNNTSKYDTRYVYGSSLFS